MHHRRTTQAVAIALSALITLCTLLALNALADSGHSTAQAPQLAAAASVRA